MVQKEPPRFFESDIAEVLYSLNGLQALEYLWTNSWWITSQLKWKLSIEIFEFWDSSCRFVSNRGIRLLQFFTRTAWWVIPAVWGPLVIYLAVLAHKGGLWLSTAPFVMAIGAFIWTFIEYLLHRYVFHMKTTGKWYVSDPAWKGKLWGFWKSKHNNALMFVWPSPGLCLIWRYESPHSLLILLTWFFLSIYLQKLRIEEICIKFAQVMYRTLLSTWLSS